MRAIVILIALSLPTSLAAEPLIIITPTDVEKLCSAEAGRLGGPSIFRDCREKMIRDQNTIIVSPELVDERMKGIIADALRARLARNQQ